MSSRVRRALISVSDKTGLGEFAKRLSKHSVEILSTGGTAKLLRAAGLEVKDVSDFTGFPEILGGRVKTLHPKVHGGLLAIRGNPDHTKQVQENGIEYIDMAVVNLYPFVETVARPGVNVEEAIENIDIGGPSMIRSASKNFEDVVVLTSPSDYMIVADEMDANGGAVSRTTRVRLAGRAFDATARYDQAIASFFANSLHLDADGDHLSIVKAERLPSLFTLTATKELDLRYGENPHQRAALYRSELTGEGVATSEKLQGKELSFNNLVDMDAAWALVTEFDQPACAIIKHTNPCGAATANDLSQAFEKALATDPVSAYGGIIAFNGRVTEDAARLVAKTFFEVIIAPDFEPGALEAFAARRNLRVMKCAESPVAERLNIRLDINAISGGLLIQESDHGVLDDSKLKVVTSRAPGDEEMRALRFAWILGKHVKSNAIVYARDGQLVGVGAGQMSRVDSVRIGAMKAQLPLPGTVLASDAFFPFRDNIDEAAKVGITAIIQPGGSVRDEEVIAAANEHNLAMVFTSLRHFRH